jgi:murein L,D-transpeptidase YafK
MNVTSRAGIIAFLAVLSTRLPVTSSAQSKVMADSIVISKSAHTLSLFSGENVLKTYSVAIGRGSAGPKQVAGDNRTPEGRYIIDQKKTATRFHKALHISYPNATDRASAAKLGKPPGGDIEIHGLPDGLGWLGSAQHLVDWTAGCIALSNSQVDEVWNIVSVGTPVEIKK